MLLILVALITIIGAAIFSILIKDHAVADEMVNPFRKKQYLMNRSEHSFFDLLQSVYGQHYYVFPQIHLDALLYANGDAKRSFSGLNRIIRNSVDFVICDRKDISPLLAINLDGYVHTWESVKRKDERIEKIIKDAGLRLERFNVQPEYNLDELKAIINLPLS